MGAERDPAGPSGSGLSGAGYGSAGGSREGSGFSTPASGGSPMGDRSGTGEVHTGLHSGRSGSEELSGLGFADAETTTGGAVRDRVMDRARSVAGTVRDRAETVGHRAGEYATQARDRLGEMSDRTNQALEQRGLLARLRENPLPALGIAFGLGFLIAGSGRGEGNSTGNRLRRELRGALMAGLTAGAAQATRGFFQSAGRSDAISSLFGGADDDSGLAPARRTGASSATRGRSSARLSGEDELRPPSHRDEL
jgi:hypothetical protein